MSIVAPLFPSELASYHRPSFGSMRGSVPQERHRWVLLIGVLVWVHHFHLFHFGHVDANNKVLKEYIEWLEYNDANLSALHFKVDHGTVSTAVRKDIPAKTPFVRIPGALAVSSISALSHSLMGDALKTAYEEHPPSESSRGLVKLVANMHYESFHARHSVFEPWLKLLSFSHLLHPLYYSRKHEQLLKLNVSHFMPDSDGNNTNPVFTMIAEKALRHLKEERDRITTYVIRHVVVPVTKKQLSKRTSPTYGDVKNRSIQARLVEELDWAYTVTKMKHLVFNIQTFTKENISRISGEQAFLVPVVDLFESPSRSNFSRPLMQVSNQHEKIRTCSNWTGIDQPPECVLQYRSQRSHSNFDFVLLSENRHLSAGEHPQVGLYRFSSKLCAIEMLLQYGVVHSRDVHSCGYVSLNTSSALSSSSPALFDHRLELLEKLDLVQMLSSRTILTIRKGEPFNKDAFRVLRIVFANKQELRRIDETDGECHTAISMTNELKVLRYLLIAVHEELENINYAIRIIRELWVADKNDANYWQVLMVHSSVNEGLKWAEHLLERKWLSFLYGVP